MGVPTLPRASPSMRRRKQVSVYRSKRETWSMI
jgi:hypothetical protein